MEIIETFSNLIDCLSFSLEQNKQINYSQEYVPNECAVGVILNKLPTYRSYLKKKIKYEYIERKNTMSKRLVKEMSSRYFENTCKKLLILAELSSQYFARYQRTYIRAALNKTRKWVYKSISHTKKETLTCQLNMRSSGMNYALKLQEFTEDYTWKRFFHYLQILSSGIAKISEKKLTKIAKDKIEEFFKHPVKVSRLVCIENLYLSENSHKKVTTRLSNHSKSLDEVKDLFSGFLTLQNSSSSIVEGKKKYKKEMLLSRMISHLSSPYWKPLTLHFYCEQSGKLSTKFVPEYNFDDTGISGVQGVKFCKLGKGVCEVEMEDNSDQYFLTLAKLQDLIDNMPLFCIDCPRFDRVKKLVLSPLSLLERAELIRVYTSINSPILHPMIIPETDLQKFEYEYILVNNNLQSKSSNGCRNWLVQLEKSSEKSSEQAICAYSGCLAQKLLAPVEFKLGEQGKTRKKLKKISGNEFCRLHQCINLLTRSKKQTYPALELWSAVQSGLLWRNTIKPSSILGKILSCQSRDLIQKNLDYKKLSISNYKSEQQLEIEKIIANPEAYEKLKTKLIEETENLKHEKQYEAAASEELRKILENLNGLAQPLINEIKSAMTKPAYEKFCILSKVREKTGRFSVSELRNYSNRSSRPSSAARDKIKEEMVGKKRIDTKLLPSPYMQNQPFEKNPSFRLKQLSQAKVPKSRSFALLDV